MVPTVCVILDGIVWKTGLETVGKAVGRRWRRRFREDQNDEGRLAAALISMRLPTSDRVSAD